MIQIHVHATKSTLSSVIQMVPKIFNKLINSYLHEIMMSVTISFIWRFIEVDIFQLFKRLYKLAYFNYLIGIGIQISIFGL